MAKKLFKRILFFAFFSLFALLLISPGKAEGKEISKEVKGIPSSPITFLALQLEQRQEKHLVIGQGFVDIRFKDFRIQADYVKLNTLTGDGIASGNVRIHDRTSRIFCERMEFNMYTRLGVMEEVNGFVSKTYYVTGKKLERTTEDRYKIQGGTVSSCEGNTPPWSFHSQEVVVKPDKYVMLKHPSLWLKKIPAFYAPFLMMPLSERARDSGFLMPSFGFSDRDAVTVKNRFYWAINDHNDATIGLDYLGKRGARPNLEYRYAWDKNITGEISTSFLHDRKTKKDFFKLNIDHRQKFQNGVEGLLRIDSVSQDDGDKKFEDDIVSRTRRYSESFVSLKKNWENQSLHFYAEHLEGVRSDRKRRNREETLSKLPEVSYTYYQKSLANTPFRFQLDSSAVDLYRKRNETPRSNISNNQKKNDQVIRLDFFPQLSMPIRRLPFVTLIPKLGFRETFFNQLSGGGKGEKSNFSRELLVFESRAEGPKVYRIFALNGKHLTAIKHIIEPRVTYQYTKNLGNNRSLRSRIPFDRIDSFGRQQNLGFSLINRFLAKQRTKENRFTSREVGRLEINQVTRINRDWVGTDNRRPFSSLNFDLDTHFFPLLEFNADASFNLDTGSMSTNNQRVKVKWPKIGYLSLDRRYFKLTDEERKWWYSTGFLWYFSEGRTEEFYNIGVGIDFIKRLKLQLATRFDATKGNQIENNYNFMYRGSCFELGIDISDRRDKFEFNFFVSLQGLGSFGSSNHKNRFINYNNLISEER